MQCPRAQTPQLSSHKATGEGQGRQNGEPSREDRAGSIRPQQCRSTCPRGAESNLMEPTGHRICFRPHETGHPALRWLQTALTEKREMLPRPSKMFPGERKKSVPATRQRPPRSTSWPLLLMSGCPSIPSSLLQLRWPRIPGSTGHMPTLQPDSTPSEAQRLQSFEERHKAAYILPSVGKQTRVALQG